MIKPPFKSHLLPIFLLLSLFCSLSTSFQFNEAGEFTILQFTDMHFNGNTTTDSRTQQLQRNMIKWAKPDLIVLSGDAVSGKPAALTGGYENVWKKWTAPINEAQIPYAYILGNHDAEGDLDKYKIVALDDTNPLSLRKKSEGMPDTTNFVVPIYSSKSQNQLAANIWLFDTGSISCDSFEYSWGCIERSQLKWYNEMSKKLKEEHGTDVHHLAFVHIPIPEYRKLYNENNIYGNAGEDIGCPFVNTNFFGNIKANNDIQAIFCGHDHLNDFGGWYHGIELAYGRKSGHGAYGKVRGARVIKLKETIDEKGNLKVTRSHFIFNEDGAVVPSEPSKPREGSKKSDCIYPQHKDVSWWRASVLKFFWELGHSSAQIVSQYL